MVDVDLVLGERFRVERLLGAGRFASVYVATDTIAGGTVALKVFKPSTDKRTVVGKRFFRRIKANKKSPHPVILPLIDGGTTGDGLPYLVMELLDGQTLGQEVQTDGALPLGRCIDIATILIQGIAAAHDKGHVHRNINPANVFLVNPEREGPPVLLLDMGVALDLVDYLAIAPSSIGSTSYLAPEILVESEKAWTPAVDVFAVGMVLFLMLVGRLPVDRELAGGDRKNTVRIYTSVPELPGPAMFAPHVPKSIDDIVKKAIEVQHTLRYKNANELLDALESATAELDLSALDETSGRASRISWTHQPVGSEPPDQSTVPEDEPPIAIKLTAPDTAQEDTTVPEAKPPVMPKWIPPDIWDDLLAKGAKAESDGPEGFPDISLSWKKHDPEETVEDEATLPDGKLPLMPEVLPDQAPADTASSEDLMESYSAALELPFTKAQRLPNAPAGNEPTVEHDVPKDHGIEPTKKLEMPENRGIEPTKKLEMPEAESLEYEPTKKLDLLDASAFVSASKIKSKTDSPVPVKSRTIKRARVSIPPNGLEETYEMPSIPDRGWTRMHFIILVCALIGLSALAYFAVTFFDW